MLLRMGRKADALVGSRSLAFTGALTATIVALVGAIGLSACSSDEIPAATTTTTGSVAATTTVPAPLPTVADGSQTGSTDRVTFEQLNLATPLQDFEAAVAEGFKPRSDLEPWPISLPIDWAADPFQDENWKFQLHALRAVDPYLIEYDRAGDPEVLASAFEILLDWHRFHVVEGKQANRSWDDMATGLRASRIAYFVYEYSYGGLTPTASEAEQLFELVDLHAEKLQDPPFISMGNHGLFQVFGLHSLCDAAQDRAACADGLSFAGDMFQAIFAGQFTDEGVHREHSPEYHIWLTGVISKRGAALAAGSPDIAAMLATAADVSPWLVFPDGTVARAGDTSSRSTPMTEFDGEPTCVAAGCFAIGDFSASGYAVVRTTPDVAEQEMLFVTGMAHGRQHKHADELSFQLFSDGQLIFVDPGKYGYDVDDARAYVTSAAAHNTISLEETPIGPRDIEYGGSLIDPISTDNDAFVVSGTVVRPDLFEHRREIAYRPGAYITVTDRIDRLVDDRVVSSLHLAPDLAAELTGDGFRVPDLIDARLMTSGCEIEVARGETSPWLGWYSPFYRQIEPSTVVRAICDAEEIVWSIELDVED